MMGRQHVPGYMYDLDVNNYSRIKHITNISIITHLGNIEEVRYSEWHLVESLHIKLPGHVGTAEISSRIRSS